MTTPGVPDSSKNTNTYDIDISAKKNVYSQSSANEGHATKPASKVTNQHVRRPIPSSVTILNESTPLIPQQQLLKQQLQQQQQNSISLHRTDPIQRRKELLGVILLVLSAGSFTAMTGYAKASSQRKFGSSFEIVFVRSVVQLVLSIAACGLFRIHPLGKPGIRRWLLLRALVMSVGLALFFYSLTVLDLLDATVLFSLGPIFTAVIASIVLDERFTSFDALCSISCLFGVVFVTKPGLFFVYNSVFPHLLNNSITQFGIECVCAGAIMSAVSNVLVRKIGKDTHFLVHSVYFGAISSLISLPGWLLFQNMHFPSSGDWTPVLYLLLVGIFAFSGQCLLHQGLKRAPPGLGIIISGSDILFAWIVGMLLFHEYSDGRTLFGSFVILGMTTALGLRKLKNRTILLAANKAARKRLSRERLDQLPNHDSAAAATAATT